MIEQWVEGLNLEIRRSERRKTAAVEVYPAGRVVLTVPVDFPEIRIKELLVRKQRWIAEKLREVSDIPAPRVKREFVSGESFPLLGKEYRLKVIHSNSAQVVLKDERLVVSVPVGLDSSESAEVVKVQLTAWYQEQAFKKFRERVAYFKRKLHVEPSKISIRHYQSRWGTCKPGGELVFNWNLIMAPQFVFDYVVVHELCHLEIPDHSPAFWKLIATVLPKYENGKLWLRFMNYKSDLAL